MKQPITWVLVADASRARILESLEPLARGRFSVVETLEHKLMASHELGSDHPGRSYDSSGGQRHAVEPRSDPHDQQKTEFAVALAKKLDHALGEKRFAKLAVVAPPVLLGRLRQALSDKAKAVLVGEIHKDFTHLPLTQLSERLQQVLA